jgi:hypothetical protein
VCVYVYMYVLAIYEDSDVVVDCKNRKEVSDMYVCVYIFMYTCAHWLDMRIRKWL